MNIDPNRLLDASARLFASPHVARYNPDMAERKPISSAPLLAVLAVVGFLLVAYVVGYLRMGKRAVVRQEIGAIAGVGRIYPHPWQVTAFQPAAAIESLCIGIQVHLGDYGTYGDPNAEEP
jgi:ABC-type cobalt transport system substrate-binding protein